MVNTNVITMQNKRIFSNDSPTVVKGLRFIMFWSDKHFVQKNSVKSNNKADRSAFFIS